jgi:Overcoming lysogenization defect protein-like, TOPRIM domain
LTTSGSSAEPPLLMRSAASREKLVDVEDAVLEQVAEPAAGAHELDRVSALDVLGGTGQNPEMTGSEKRSETTRPEAGFARAVVLVEGTSDQAALEALAQRRGRDLGDEGVEVVSIGGAQAIGHFLESYGTRGSDVRLAGLCDAAEERHFRRALERAGLGSELTRVRMERLGFYVCVADLEDELIRALGAEAVEEVIEAQGDLGSFRTLQKQPAWQGRAREDQLRRFMGSGGRRKIRYARLLVDALDLARVPRPLDGVLSHV